MEYLWVEPGGFAGANTRYALGRWIANRYGDAFPHGTVLINVSEALLTGVVPTLLTERVVADPLWRLLVVVGFLGGYTTFSTYAADAFLLAERGEWGRAAADVLGSNALGLGTCVAGVLLARSVGR